MNCNFGRSGGGWNWFLGARRLQPGTVSSGAAGVCDIGRYGAECAKSRRAFAHSGSGRDSPTSCGPRFRLQAKPFESMTSAPLEQSYSPAENTPQGERSAAPNAKRPDESGLFSILAERTGLAHILRAAVSLASETLRVPPRSQQGERSAAPNAKRPDESGLFSILAERTGLAHILRAAVSLASETLRVPPRSQQGERSAAPKEKGPDGAFFDILAERTGLAHILRAAASLASEALRVLPRSPQGERSAAPNAKRPDESGLFSILAERTGLAHIMRAAVSLASETLRVPPRSQ